MVASCAKGSRHTVTDGTNVSIEVIRNALMSPRVRPWHISALKPHLCLNCQKEESVLSNCLEALDVSHLCGNHRHPDNGLRLGRGGAGDWASSQTAVQWGWNCLLRGPPILCENHCSKSYCWAKPPPFPPWAMRVQSTSYFNIYKGKETGLSYYSPSIEVHAPLTQLGNNLNLIPPPSPSPPLKLCVHQPPDMATPGVMACLV